MTQPIGVAIIGSGLFVKAEHLPAVLGNAKLDLKALYSRSLKSARETASQIKDAPRPDLYSDDAPGSNYADLLRRQDVRAVIVALPIASQPSYVQAALAAGKHVLAEKPIAKDVATAQALISFHDSLPGGGGDGGKPILAVAENFRLVPRLLHAAGQARALGRVTHFSVRVAGLVRPDNKYYGTSWRASPAYQGGFLLDGGVHHAAATRLFLRGEGDAPASVRAFTALTRSHLAPIDTVTAIVRTESGATGTYFHSAGSLMSAFEWEVACERGVVRSDGDVVTVTGEDGSKAETRFERTSGVREEVDAWAGSILDGRGVVVPLQSAREALADLEFLENMFASGAEDGEERRYVLQKW
ncbi:oxidoreductase family, NAD-binding Rossmann fold protein [Metarhizium acridum CQMa 102]|uniref:Oxidoreductase family, NAD-binding Rossmann fold protein n=1 Tax=Metarhizium acridum (strain CQMa 102) TaxID=655827 RepID=E9E3S6_METAQ|nr:oxidoreductase family, NAD-binding Rossmann fold protein [Metarhizium acridum CQMa 102]EFY89501.1 oxidoreductase family, NAD-binding Rossmann fold protein [Metarhizium acridum CQMa 102]